MYFMPSGVGNQPYPFFVQTIAVGFSQLVSSSVPGFSVRTPSS